jgi:hypothetical protein
MNAQIEFFFGSPKIADYREGRAETVTAAVVSERLGSLLAGGAKK